MNELSVLKFMGECGFRFAENEIVPAVEYLKNMRLTDKILTIFNGPNLHAIVIYSVTNNDAAHLKKKTWEFMDSEIDGRIIVIDYMACKEFDVDLRNEIRNYFRIKHPQFEYATWKRFRKPFDKIVKAYKEKIVCTQ